MNKSQLVDSLIDRMEDYFDGDSKQKSKVAKQGIDLFFSSIKDALQSGDRVEIRGLGSFSLKDYEGYTGRNPKTGENVTVCSKRLPVFKAGKDLKKRVDNE